MGNIKSDEDNKKPNKGGSEASITETEANEMLEDDPASAMKNINTCIDRRQSLQSLVAKYEALLQDHNKWEQNRKDMIAATKDHEKEIEARAHEIYMDTSGGTTKLKLEEEEPVKFEDLKNNMKVSELTEIMEEKLTKDMILNTKFAAGYAPHLEAELKRQAKEEERRERNNNRRK